MNKKNKILFFLILAFFLPKFLYSWDMYFGAKGGLGFGGAMLEVSLSDISPRDFSTTVSRQDRRGRLVALGVFDANFISPVNLGFEFELGYRLAGERIYDNNEKRHALKLHYIDFSAILKYWLFGKIISTGIGLTFSYLTKAEIIDFDVAYNFKAIDISSLIKINFNYWDISNKIILSTELRFIIGFNNIIKYGGKFNNIGIFFCFGIHFIHKSEGENLQEFRY